jgi:hypothetical protein
MSRQTRATIVVSHPPRFSTPFRVGAAEPEPGFLDSVVCLADGAEHSVGDRPQAGPVLLEPLRQPFALIHGHIPSLRSDIPLSSEPQPM